MIDDPLIGCQLANFRIERALGRGGMAQVYYGQDVKLQRPVAIKVIDARYRDNPAYAQRFVREAQAIANWRHEHIVQIHYAGDQDGLYYFVMEHIDRLDLGQLIAQYAANDELMPQTEVLRIGRAVASALDYAHRRGVIHRDVKPSNVLMANDGRVVLADFGLAMEIEQGSVGEAFGSANYIAPEQARRSSEAVPQSDLYSLGIMLYEMLTGQVPFDDPSSTAVAIQHLTLPPPPPRELNPALNEATEAVLLKALSKPPGERYQTGQALLDALAEALQVGQPALVRQVEPPPTLPELSLPPVIEGPAITQRMSAPVPPTAPAPASTRRPIYLSAGIGLVAIVLCTAVLLLGLFLRLRGSGVEIAAQVTLAAESEAIAIAGLENNGAATTQPTLLSTQALPAVIPATEPPPTVTPILVVPPSEPALTPTPAPSAVVENPTGYDFLIAKWGEESVFIVNLAADPLPLAPLRLSNDKGGVNGAGWGVETLVTGDCVAAWKDEEAYQSLEVSCHAVGPPLVVEGGNFWRRTFEVYYGEQLIGVCQKDETICSFNTATVFSGTVDEGGEDKEKKEEGDD